MGMLEGKTALVTGGGSGIGFAVAERFHEEGATVFICGRREPTLKDACDRVDPAGDRIHGIAADVTKDEDIKAVIGAAVETTGRIDILVNSHGLLRFGKLEETDPKLWDEVVRINAFGAWRTMVAVLPEMRKCGGGSIINISSVNGIRVYPGAGLYNTSKAALNMLSQVLALEVCKDNIRVNMVLPGTVEDTGFIPSVVEREKVADFYSRLRTVHPLGRNARPRDVADAALFLASDQATYITGTMLNVDGGRHMATNRPVSGEET